MYSLSNLLNEAFPPSFFIAKVGSPVALGSLASVDMMAAEGTFPMLGDLLPAFYLAILLCMIRWMLHRCLFRPLALRCLCLKPVTLCSNNLLLTQTFQKNRTPSVADIEHLLVELNKQNNTAERSLTVENIQQDFWLRRRHVAQELRVTKFVEALWRSLFYSSALLTGFFTLWYPVTMPWMQWNGGGPFSYFNHWPLEPINSGIQAYYMLELGSYLHQLLWTDVTRSDAVEMTVHHIVTITLIAVSYLLQFMRIGTVIMALHDIPDVFLETGKCLNYMSKAKGQQWIAFYTDIFFGFFATSFFITRIVLYPIMLWQVNSVCASVMGDGNSTSYLFFLGLLMALQALHCFWFYLILRMVYRLLWVDGELDDIRSDDDEEDELTGRKEAKAQGRGNQRDKDGGGDSDRDIDENRDREMDKNIPSDTDTSMRPTTTGAQSSNSITATSATGEVVSSIGTVSRRKTSVAAGGSKPLLRQRRSTRLNTKKEL